jgi:fumarate reductase subunit D
MLYAMFFAAIIISVVWSVMGTDFKTGWKYAMLDAKLSHDGDKYTENMRFFDVPIRYDADRPVDIPSNNEEVRLSGSVHSADVLMERADNPPFSWKMFGAGVCTGVSVALYICIFIFIFKILNSLRKGLKTNELFPQKNIARTRMIGKMLVVAAIMTSMSQYIEISALADLVAGDIIDTSINIEWGEIITGILILFIAEIFTIGYDISEENKLTI